MKTLLFIFTFIIVSFCQLSAQVEKPITVKWDPPSLEEEEFISGYNIYQVFIKPEVKPLKYDINLVTPLSSQYTVTYQKINSSLIPKGVYSYTIEKASPGMQTVVRAYSAEWDEESPDSDILTFRPLPKKPNGFKSAKVVVEGSVNKKHWTQRAIVELAMRNSKEQFRITW